MAEERLHSTQSDQCPRAVLVSLDLDDGTDVAASLQELERLADTAGAQTVGTLVQARVRPDGATCLGKGKLMELALLCQELSADLAIFDLELSPMQIRNVENALADGVRVIDRTMLILDIFAANARTAEGMLQVEIAELKYSIPRLIGSGRAMSRLGGGIGTRGPGESKLELDRRRARERIGALEHQLRELEAKRLTQRKGREKAGMFQIAVAGYTNAGKSTLLNCLTGSDILCADRLFATLDPTTRRLRLPEAGEVLITDTVGFVDRLPHHLVEAFKSTLDEVCYADLLLVVLDASDEQMVQKFNTTTNILQDLYRRRGLDPAPRLYVFNQCDKPQSQQVLANFYFDQNCVCVSALTGMGIEELCRKIETVLQEKKRRCVFCFPPQQGAGLSYLYRTSTVEEVSYDPQGNAIVRAVCDAKTRGMYAQYLIPQQEEGSQA